MPEIMTVVGARPQFVKAAMFSRAIAACEGAREILVHSGQHYDANMSDVFFAEMSLPEPDHHLGVGVSGHSELTAAIMTRLDALLAERSPDWLVVFGDTNTTLAAALVCAKRQVPLAHIEAGLRSFNRAMPEEVNRVVTDVLADRLYAPSAVAVENLAREGVPPDRIVRCGDIMFDAVRAYGEQAAAKPLPFNVPASFALLTLHRQENVDDAERLTAIIACLERVAGEIPIVCPLHPRTRKRLAEFNLWQRWDDCVQSVDPVGYLNMLGLLQRSEVVLTDSGGLQKEAFFLERPCCTLRTETEWVELVELGWNCLVDVADPAAAAARVLSRRGQRGQPGMPYGDGATAQYIVEDLLCAG